MTVLDPIKKETRQQMRRYKTLPINSKWRAIIDAVYHDYQQEFPDKAWLLSEVYMAGRSRHHRMNYPAMAAHLHVSEGTVDEWLKEIALEVALRASKERLI